MSKRSKLCVIHSGPGQQSGGTFEARRLKSADGKTLKPIVLTFDQPEKIHPIYVAALTRAFPIRTSPGGRRYGFEILEREVSKPKPESKPVIKSRFPASKSRRRKKKE